MKTNVIPDTVEIGVDVRTLPGEGHDDVTAHLKAALGDLYDKVDVEVIMDDPASISRVDNPLWNSLERAIAKPFPTARPTPQLVVGFTDARIYRNMGAIAYGTGLFSPDVEPAEFGRRFHGNDERIDVESLRLTTQLWLDVVQRPAWAEATFSPMAETISFPSNGSDAAGTSSDPRADPGPGVLVIQEWWGLDCGIKEMADRARCRRLRRPGARPLSRRAGRARRDGQGRRS